MVEGNKFTAEDDHMESTVVEIKLSPVDNIFGLLHVFDIEVLFKVSDVLEPAEITCPVVESVLEVTKEADEDAAIADELAAIQAGG